MTLSGFNLDFCLSPILIVGHLKNTASLMPLDEFPKQIPKLDLPI